MEKLDIERKDSTDSCKEMNFMIKVSCVLKTYKVPKKTYKRSIPVMKINEL